MNYLVVLVVNDIDDTPEILNAWEDAGVLGITILESTGLGRIRRAGLREDIPIMPSLHDSRMRFPARDHPSGEPPFVLSSSGATENLSGSLRTKGPLFLKSLKIRSGTPSGVTELCSSMAERSRFIISLPSRLTVAMASL